MHDRSGISCSLASVVHVTNQYFLKQQTFFAATFNKSVLEM